MWAQCGQTLCSGPTHVAVDNFAARIDTVGSSVAAHCNHGRAQGDGDRQRRPWVIRGYNQDDELAAFQSLLQNPNAGDSAGPNHNGWHGLSTWKLHLSVAFWLLVLLRSPARGVRELGPDDSAALHGLAERIAAHKGLKRLRAVASGEMTWQEYEAGEMVAVKTVGAMMATLVSEADLLCTTPEMTEKVGSAYAKFKATAKAVAIDEAGNMHRADYYCVAGNTLLPCFLGGDLRQFSPRVLSAGETTDEKKEVFVHRFSDDAKISPLEFFQACGMPVYRLLVQVCDLQAYD